MFQRSGPAEYKVDLSNTLALCEALGNPEAELEVIHIAGTNGKGSVSHAVAAALQARGLRVGLYTSPHLFDPRERIRVNGELISESDFTGFVSGHLDLWSRLQPSFFELMFAMALVSFRNAEVDVVVLETGMGGRLDSTNIFARPLATAITSIGLDHQQFLGDSIRAIAGEKAGILKEGVPCVLGMLPPEARSVVLERSLRLSVEVHDGLPGDDPADEPTWLSRNRAVARRILALIDGDRSTDEGVLSAGPSAWGLLGRWQWWGPDVLLDCAHNTEGLTETGRALRALNRPLKLVFGTVKDKDVEGALVCLPQAQSHHWCAAGIPRAMPVEELAFRASGLGRAGVAYSNVTEALKGAMGLRTGSELVVVLGSVFTVGEALQALKATAGGT